MSSGLKTSMKTKTQLLKKKLKQSAEFNIHNYTHTPMSTTVSKDK